MTEIKYKGRKIRVARTTEGWGFEVSYRQKPAKFSWGYARRWTALRGAKRAVDRKEA